MATRNALMASAPYSSLAARSRREEEPGREGRVCVGGDGPFFSRKRHAQGQTSAGEQPDLCGCSNMYSFVVQLRKQSMGEVRILVPASIKRNSLESVPVPASNKRNSLESAPDSL